MYASINFSGTAYQRATKLLIANQLLSVEGAKKSIIPLHHGQPTSTDNQVASEAVIITVKNNMRNHGNAL